MTKIMTVRSLKSIFIISPIAFAAPVLDFPIKKSVKKETAMTRVFIEPKRIRNCLLLRFLKNEELIIAAWLLPIPGKKEQIGEINVVAKTGVISSFLSILNFSIICSGI